MNERRLFTPFALLAYTLTNGYTGHPVCQEPITLNMLDSNQSVPYLPDIMPTCSRELKKFRKEEEAMAAATLQKEKEAAERLQQEEKLKVAAALALSTTKEFKLYHRLYLLHRLQTSPPFLLVMLAKRMRQSQKPVTP
jgi:hypothetical protein